MFLILFVCSGWYRKRICGCKSTQLICKNDIFGAHFIFFICTCCWVFILYVFFRNNSRFPPVSKRYFNILNFPTKWSIRLFVFQKLVLFKNIPIFLFCWTKGKKYGKVQSWHQKRVDRDILFWSTPADFCNQNIKYKFENNDKYSNKVRFFLTT